MRAHSKTSLLVTVGSIIRKYEGNWCYAGQTRILELIKDIHGIDIKRRQLNYHLADLREGGLIRTIKRTRRNADGTITLLSSATCLTQKGCWRLIQLGVRWAISHLRKLKRKYMPPSPESGDPGENSGSGGLGENGGLMSYLDHKSVTLPKTSGARGPLPDPA